MNIVKAQENDSLNSGSEGEYLRMNAFFIEAGGVGYIGSVGYQRTLLETKLLELNIKIFFNPLYYKIYQTALYRKDVNFIPAIGVRWKFNQKLSMFLEPSVSIIFDPLYNLKLADRVCPGQLDQKCSTIPYVVMNSSLGIQYSFRRWYLSIGSSISKFEQWVWLPFIRTSLPF